MFTASLTGDNNETGESLKITYIIVINASLKEIIDVLTQLTHAETEIILNDPIN